MKKQIYKLVAFGLYLFTLSPILAIFNHSIAFAVPALCYTTTGPLQVAPTTSGCTVDPGGRIVYINTAGQTVSSPEEDACYTGAPASGSGTFQSRTFNQQTCADLRTLLAASRQALCTASGGSWTTYAGGGVPRADCSCGEGRALNTASYQCGAIVANPNGGATDESSIETVNGPTVDCVSEGGTGDLNGENCKIVGLLNTVFNLVSGGIALAVIGNIIVAGIQYSTAQGDPSASGKAKNRIQGALIAFLMYLGLYAFLQWLIPGGVF